MSLALFMLNSFPFLGSVHHFFLDFASWVDYKRQLELLNNINNFLLIGSFYAEQFSFHWLYTPFLPGLRFMTTL